MDYSRKRKKRKIKIVILLVSLILVITFSIYCLKKERNLTIVEKIVKDSIINVGKVLYAPVDYVKEKIDVYKEKEDIYVKYKKLQKEESSLNQKNARIEELEKENKELKKLLNINTGLSDYDVVNASIISRNASYWQEKITINKGSKDGIKNKMPVVNSSGIVGYISEVRYTTSNVQLLTSQKLKSKISVKIETDDKKYVNGLLIGYDKDEEIFKVEGISYNGKIPENAKVITTGLSDNFPSGILIGTVVNTTTDNFDLGKIVEVKPAVNFNDINYLSVLKRKD